MMFPFTLGMLMARLFSQRTMDNKQQSFFTNNIFWIATIVLFALFSVPYISGEDVTSRVPTLANISLNGIYELFCIMVVFPLIVWIAALSDSAQSKFTLRISKFLGDLSYPLYIVHYPVMYLFYAWLIKNQYFTLGETWQMVILVLTVCIVLAYACLKLYDEPIRKKLSKLIRG